MMIKCPPLEHLYLQSCLLVNYLRLLSVGWLLYFSSSYSFFLNLARRLFANSMAKCIRDRTWGSRCRLPLFYLAPISTRTSPRGQPKRPAQSTYHLSFSGHIDLLPGLPPICGRRGAIKTRFNAMQFQKYDKVWLCVKPIGLYMVSLLGCALPHNTHTHTLHLAEIPVAMLDGMSTERIRCRWDRGNIGKPRHSIYLTAATMCGIIRMAESSKRPKTILHIETGHKLK